MKQIYSRLFILTVLFSMLFITPSCDNKPFEGVDAILTNPKIDYEVKIQILDADPNATNPYPASPIVTLSGEAVDKGLIYTTGGDLLNASAGNAKVINNTVSLAVKPNTKISLSQPLKFYIKAEANNYLSNSKEITISSLDDLQYINLSLLKLTSLPVGIANTTVQATAVAGSIGTNFTVNVGSGTVSATIPGNTVFFDATNAAITTAGNFNISATSFSASTPAAVAALPGGISATTSTNEHVTFAVAGAVDINAGIGGKTIKSFSNPIPFAINLASGTFNPTTNAALTAGDQLTVWSKDADSMIWKNEGVATVVNNGSGNLKTTIQVSHLSTWMVASGIVDCSNQTTFNYVSNSTLPTPVFVEVKIAGGTNQVVFSGTNMVANGDKIVLRLPKNVSFKVFSYAGSSASGTPFSTIDLAACATSGTITNNVVSTNPTLSFDLETNCSDGKFRYSGSISYKLSSDKTWSAFTPSVDGKLTTDLLAWDKKYDFRVSYRGVDYSRTRTVLQSEFRLNGTVWKFFGTGTTQQTFFNAPTNCN
jgi:hypothetical protein